MITLKQWMKIVNYRITEGSDYHNAAFGDNQYSLSAWNGDHDGWSFNIVFDTKDQTIFMVEACDYKNQRAYRLINPDYQKAHDLIPKGNYRDQAWDDVNFVDLETDEDWLEKAKAIIEGLDYDTRVSVPLDIPESDLLMFMKAAHERDMTFNQFVEEAIKEAVKEFELNPEAFTTRAKRFIDSQNDD